MLLLLYYAFRKLQPSFLECYDRTALNLACIFCVTHSLSHGVTSPLILHYIALSK